MSHQWLLLIHPTFGVLGMIAAVWMFVEALNARENNNGRIQAAAWTSAVMIWIACITAGYFYVLYYGADKATIKTGPWPWAHSLFMESKEHIFFMLLLLASFLPVVARAQLWRNGGARTVALWSSAFVVLMGLAMEGAGAVVSMGDKMGLLAKIGG